MPSICTTCVGRGVGGGGGGGGGYSKGGGAGGVGVRGDEVSCTDIAVESKSIFPPLSLLPLLLPLPLFLSSP